MGRFRRNKKEAEMRSIIYKIYGGDINRFAFNYANNIYNIPEVRTAIEVFANICSTIPIYHERVDKKGNITYLEDEVTSILSLKPNALQNASQFWSSVYTQLMLYNNVFLEPIFDTKTGRVKELYPLPYRQCEFELKNAIAYVRFLDSDTPSMHELNRYIYLNRFSMPGRGSVSNNLGLYETVIQALMQQAVNVADPKKPKAILQTALGASGQNLKKKDKTAVMNDVKMNSDENVGGIMYLDGQWQVTPINWQDNDVNRDLMKFVVNIVWNYFGISEGIVTNRVQNDLEMSMFVQNKVQPIANQVAQGLTLGLFTRREIEMGNRIELDVFALNVRKLSDIVALFSTVGRNGVMSIDEMREYIGMAPLENGLGKMHRVTGDTMNLINVDKFQAAQKGAVDKNVKEEFDGKA